MSAHAHAAHVHHPSPAPPLAPTPAAAPAAHPSAPPAVETPEPAAVPAVVLRPALRRRLDLHRGPRERVEGRSPLGAAHAVLAHGFAVRERGESRRVIRVGDKAETLVRVGHVHVQHLPKLGKVLPDRLHGHRRLEPADEHLRGVRQVGEPRWEDLQPATVHHVLLLEHRGDGALVGEVDEAEAAGPAVWAGLDGARRHLAEALEVLPQSLVGGLPREAPDAHVRTDVIVAGPWRRRRRGRGSVAGRGAIGKCHGLIHGGGERIARVGVIRGVGVAVRP